jgi:hypothetical protein
MVRSGEGFAAARKKQREMRAGGKARKAKKAAHAKSSTGKMARDLATVKGSKTPASVKAAMAKSIRRKQAKKANYQHEG